jgi:hypothetical protein
MLDHLVRESFAAKDAADQMTPYFPNDYIKLQQLGDAQTKANLKLIRYVVRHAGDLIRECGGRVAKEDQAALDEL